MKKPISLSIFFPAYNEEANLTETVERALAYLESESRISACEIIIINDGSKDSTAAIADSLSEMHQNVRVIHHSPNHGYGAALISGIQAATNEYIFFTDTDLQFDITELSRLLAFVPEYEFVTGVRSPRRDPFMRLLNAKGWNFLNRVLFGLRVKDIDCAFKLFRRDLVQSLEIESRGAMISAEILIRVTRNGIPLKEVTVTHLPRVAGSPTGAKPSVILRAFKEMIQLYRGNLGSRSQKQMIKYMVVGAINTIIDIVVYVALTRGLHVDSITLAKLLSFMAGSVSSYILNRQWTFRVTTGVGIREIARFYSTQAVSLGVNLVMMNILTGSLHIYDLIALLITTVVTFAISFTLSRAWVFISHVQHVPNISTASPTRP